MELATLLITKENPINTPIISNGAPTNFKNPDLIEASWLKKNQINKPGNNAAKMYALILYYYRPDYNCYYIFNFEFTKNSKIVKRIHNPANR